MSLYDNIPQELKQLDQWVGVCPTNKQPMKAWEKTPASVIDSTTWSNFITADFTASIGEYNDIGFVFNNNGLVGIDIDDGIDDDGFLSNMCVDIINMCKSYTEFSMSGTGVHIILKGDLPFNGKNNHNAGIEIYKNCRYFIMTGEVITYKNIIENQKAIDYIIDTYFKFDDNARYTIYPLSYEFPVLKRGKILLKPVYLPIEDGNRNNSLASLAGQLHANGYSKNDIINELIACNEIACLPPLPVKEIKAIAASISKYER